ncbi:MAG: N-6 DNA methylase [Actinobacteria bacterium]|nr:N-6 DNA methylase [Actinomycetota bacterium]
MSTGDTTIETARAKIAELVERFRANEAAYKNPAYNETMTRREFIDPFFKALGWDVDNERGYAPAYKDVIHEDAIKVGGMTKAPDYCFRIGGQRKFFVEAKKPSVDMKNDPEPYYQLRRYAYSAKLPLSIVTDFQELAIVDCRAKPSPKEKASTGRIRYWHYEEYPDHIEELLETFSPEGIKKGGLDKMAITAKSKRGTGEVDKEFLREIETWRELLARNIAIRNPGLSQRELNEAVQVTIDRIIFLRICEDRGIEEYGQLQAMQNGANIYARLCELFQKADERYNSGLFHFREERGNPSHPDELTLGLAIDDKTLKQIVKGLYYPDSPYEFSVLPIDILGQVYEQFLGKVIRLTAGHQAKIEDKPEVKKAGGVYYTPTYIVDYIVRNTVGKLLEGSTPTKAAKLRILDPACGSGSFLIGAYEYLLDWHRDWYSENDAEKWAKGKEPRLFEGKNGWQLTTAEKKRILLNNIYGVDIDPQAVEVSKLSLLLKVLEEESQETMNAQLKFFHERALPDLGNNIKCGNSLIGTDFFEGQQLGLLDEEEALRINAFDWDGPDGFPEIMKSGGFDAVIGNPPYGLVTDDLLKNYFENQFIATEGRVDNYELFIEQGIGLCKEGLPLGLIVPSPLLSNLYARKLRQFILKNSSIKEITNFGMDVFTDPTIHTCIIILARGVKLDHRIKVRKQVIAEQQLREDFDYDVLQSGFVNTENATFDIFIDPSSSQLMKKLFHLSRPLGDICYIRQCIKTGNDKLYVTKSVSRPSASWKPTLRGKSISRYATLDACLWLNYGPWLARNWKNVSFYETPKIAIRETGNRITATVDFEERYFLSSLYSIYPKKDEDHSSLLFILGLLNSSLATFFVKKVAFDLTKGAFTKTRTNQLGRLPIHRIDFSNSTDKSRHDQMVELVERMLEMNKRLQAAKTAHEKESLQRQIDATDRQIDRLVYELYDLTDDEIKIVESA